MKLNRKDLFSIAGLTFGLTIISAVVFAVALYAMVTIAEMIGVSPDHLAMAFRHRRWKKPSESWRDWTRALKALRDEEVRIDLREVAK